MQASLFRRSPKDKRRGPTGLACLFYLNKQQSPGQLACLFYLKKVTGTAFAGGKSQWQIKNLPSFLMGGSEATVI